MRATRSQVDWSEIERGLRAGGSQRQRAQTALFSALQPELSWFRSQLIDPSEAPDAVQDLLVSVVAAVDGGRPITNFASFVQFERRGVRRDRNRVVQPTPGRRVEPRAFVDELDPAAPAGSQLMLADPDSAFEARSLNGQLVHTALAEMARRTDSTIQRRYQVLVLYYFGQLSHGEIARRLGILPTTSRADRARGLSLLRSILAELGYQGEPPPVPASVPAVLLAPTLSRPRTSAPIMPSSSADRASPPQIAGPAGRA